tara:strand:- start:332 stop:1348 length:1017 start_codon:yes stop_codon:yes gene_type:complete
MIKLKNILRESKARGILSEAFRSSILRKMTNNFTGLDKDFFSYTAKHGVQWDKITDDQLTMSKTPKKKGIEFAMTTRKVSLETKKGYFRHPIDVDKNVAVLTMKDGKPLWFTKSWNASKKQVKATGKRSSVSGGPRSSLYGDNKETFGLNHFGYQSLRVVRKIPGIVFYQVSLEDNQPYMGGKEKRELRQAAGEGSWKFKNDRDFKYENDRRYENLLNQVYKDTEKVNAKVKAAKDFTNGLIATAIGGKQDAKFKKLLNKYNSWKMNDEAKVYDFLTAIAREMQDLYTSWERYIESVKYDEMREKQAEEKGEKFTYYRAPDDGRAVAQKASRILKGNF